MAPWSKGHVSVWSVSMLPTEKLLLIGVDPLAIVVVAVVVAGSRFP